MLIAAFLAVCEVTTTNDLPVHWSTIHATLRATEWAACHANALDLAGSEMSKLTPVALPPVVQSIGNGHFASASTNNLTEGMFIFRIWLSCMPHHQECLNCNRMFEVLVQGVGMASFEAQQMALINDELELPQSSEEFRGCINGYQVFLCASNEAMPTP